jgi:hypothetical protein
MNIKELKALIERLPDETPVLIPGSDHSYRSASAEATTALQERRNQWAEDYGEDTTPENAYGKRMRVVVVS